MSGQEKTEVAGDESPLLQATGEGCKPIWDRVFHTDPAFTKSFDNGFFRGTSIKPMYLIMKATQLWGPIGGNWGYEVTDDKIVPGGPLGFDDTGNSLGLEQIHMLKIRFWYYEDTDYQKGSRQKKNEFESFGATRFVSRTALGVITDEDAWKKSLTDALGKALSMVGFSADVYMGLFEDCKYMNGLFARFGAPESEGSLVAGQSSQGTVTDDGTNKPSEGYLMFKAKLEELHSKNESLSNPQEARKQVLQRSGMTESERQEILSHPLFKAVQQPQSGADAQQKTESFP